MVDAMSSAPCSSSPPPLSLPPPPLDLRFRFRFLRGHSRCGWRLDDDEDAITDDDDDEEKDDVCDATGDGDAATPDVDNRIEAAAEEEEAAAAAEAAADEKARLREERRDEHQRRVCAQLGVTREAANWVDVMRPPAMVSGIVRAMNARVGQPVGDDETHMFSGAYGWGPCFRPYASGSHIRVSGRIASVGDRSKPGTLNFGSGDMFGCDEGPDAPVVVVRDQITGAFRTFYIDTDDFRGVVVASGDSDCMSLGHVFDDAKRSVGLLSLATTDAARVEAMRDVFGWWHHAARFFGENPSATSDLTDRPLRPLCPALGTVPGILALVEAYVF
jgi:hypothetical protein